MIFNQFSFALISSFSYSSDPHLTDYLEGEFLDEQVMECFSSVINYSFAFAFRLNQSRNTPITLPT
jgi:hypothetical protein